jgi:hypothetical protein
VHEREKAHHHHALFERPAMVSPLSRETLFFLLAGWLKSSFGEHFLSQNASEIRYFSSCLAGKMGAENVMTPSL